MKTKLLIIAFCLLLIPGLISAQDNMHAGDIMIDHANSLEIYDDLVILTGGVVVSSDGKDAKGDTGFTLFTPSLILSDGSFMETFGRSEIISGKFSIKADKIYFDADTDELNTVGNVQIHSLDKKQNLIAPKVKIDLKEKILFASEGVKSEMISSDGQADDEKETYVITSPVQRLNLEYVAGEQILLASQGAHATFTDGTVHGQTIEIYEPLAPLNRKVAVRGDSVCQLQETLVMADKADIYTDSEGQLHRAFFEGSAKLDSPENELISKGDSIEYFFKSENMSVLGDLAFIESKNKKAWAEEIYLLQDAHKQAQNDQNNQIASNSKKSNNNKKAKQNKGTLWLYGKARILENNQEIRSDLMNISLDNSDLETGPFGRTKGVLWLDEQEKTATDSSDSK